MKATAMDPHFTARWGGVGEERQVALPPRTYMDQRNLEFIGDLRRVELRILAMKANAMDPHSTAWWGGLGEERQVALPPRT